MDKVWYLKRINIFSGLSDKEMEMVSHVSFMKKYSKKETIYLPGDRKEQIYLLKSGRVKISKLSAEGKELILTMLGPGDVFGEMALVDDSPSGTIAETMDETHICVISRKNFEALLTQKPELAFQITKLIGLRRKELETKIEDLIFRDVHSRLAHLLLRLAQEHGLKRDRGILVNIKLTHYEIASLIGSTRETTTVCLNDFKKEGLLDFDRRKILLLNEAELKRKIRT
ncbi:MAG TPA: Crp/Fnr family transcriptional regulator [Candidatus Aminicenantes bacterium]|nr:Crp/Fnr family transcriptional regulator [Candidatus Aminicenantes bacterium]HEB34532.1 Crp/Fnr family transcriptional regulator [Candidatus Aminicenantes bacterium]